MEDIRLAASVFFEQNPQLKNITQTEFSTLTPTKQGWVAKEAFDKHLWQGQPGCSSSNLAAKLNSDSGGFLTLDDFLVHCYLFQTPVCGYCKAIVKLVLYSYDLCPKCYLRKKFSHPHKLFVDNHAMFNKVRKPPKDVSIGVKVATTMGVGLTAGALGKGVIDAFLPGSGN